MAVMLLVAVAPRTGKIIKNGLFLKEEKIYYKMVYYTFFSERALALKGVQRKHVYPFFFYTFEIEISPT